MIFVDTQCLRRENLATSMTARALADLRKAGYTAQVVERWNSFAKVRQDLFGCIDIVALTDRGILGIQVTSAANHAARRTKVLGISAARDWLNSGGRIEIWSYKKVKHRWERRVEEITRTCLTLDGQWSKIKVREESNTETSE